ncbi:MAG: hypothetical protein ACO3N7_09410 [Kiritimatiellia bacterium]
MKFLSSGIIHSVRLSVQILLFAGALGFGLSRIYGPTLESGFSRMQSDAVDTRLNHYFLEHSYRWAFDRDYAFPLWSPPFYAPAENVLALSDNLLGTAPLYWMLREFFSVTQSYQGWLIAISSLSFIAAFVFLFRMLRISFLLSLAGAYVFAFGLQVMNQIGHPQLLGQMYAPFALGFYLEFLKNPRTRNLFLTLFFVGLQLAAGIYLGWFLGLGLLIFSFFYWLADPSVLLRGMTYFKSQKVSSSCVCIFMLLLIFRFMLPYLRMSAGLEGGGWGFETLKPFLYPLKAWVFPNALSEFWQRVGVSSSGWPEGPHSLGLFGLFLFAATLTAAFLLPKENGSRVFVRAALITCVALVLLSVSFPGGGSAWKLIYKIFPGASAIRAVNRIWTVVYLFLIPAGMLSIHALLSSRGTLFRTLAGTVLLGIAVLENIPAFVPSFDPAPYTQRISRLQESMDGVELVYFTASPHRNGAEELLDFMWAGLMKNIPVVNGTSSRPPPGYPQEVLNMQTHHLLQWLGDRAPGTLTRIYPADLIWEDSLLGSSENPNQPPVSRTDLVVRYEIPLPLPERYGQRFVFIDPPETLRAGTRERLTLAILNTGSFVWGHQWPDLVQASGRWFEPGGSMLPANPPRTALPRPQLPGEWVVIRLEIDVPEIPGVYRFEPTMVRENVAWFHDHCPPGAALEIQVRP